MAFDAEYGRTSQWQCYGTLDLRDGSEHVHSSQFSNGESLKELSLDGKEGSKILELAPENARLLFSQTSETGTAAFFPNWDPLRHFSLDAIQAAFPSGPESVPPGTTERLVALTGFAGQRETAKIISTRLAHQPLHIKIIDSAQNPIDVTWDGNLPLPLPDDYGIGQFLSLAYPGFSGRHFTTLGEARATKVLAIDPAGRIARPLPQALASAIDSLWQIMRTGQHFDRTAIEQALHIKLTQSCDAGGNNPETPVCRFRAELPFGASVGKIGVDVRRLEAGIDESVTLALSPRSCIKQSDLAEALGNSALASPVAPPPIIDTFGQSMTAAQYRRAARALELPRSYFFLIAHTIDDDRRVEVKERHGCAASISFSRFSGANHCPDPALAADGAS